MVVMGVQWFSVTLCYYGLSFASTRLSDNLYTNFILRQVPSNANTGLGTAAVLPRPGIFRLTCIHK